MEIREFIERGGTAVPPIEQQAREFLTVIWNAIPAGSVIGLSADKPYFNRKENIWKDTTIADWAFIDDVYEFEAWASAQNNNPQFIERGYGSIFVNVAARKPIILSVPHPENKRGTYDELVGTCAFYVDLDISDGGGDFRRLYDEIRRFALPPTVIVHSGGGLQIWWALNEAWSLDTRASALQFKAYLHKLTQMVESHLGFEPDYQVVDPARMMRVPGYVNRKRKRNGALAQIVYWSPDTRYSIAEVKALIGDLPEPPKPKQPVTAIPPSDEVYLVGESFLRYFVHNVNAESTKRHDALLDLACQAAKAGISRADFTQRIRALAIRWYADDPHDQGPYGELDDIIDWTYQKFDPHAVDEHGNPYFAHGTWSVQITERGFGLVIDVQTAEARQRNKVITIDKAPEPPERLPLDELRKEQRKWIREKLREPLRNVAKTFLVATSPGTGKTFDLTHETLNEVLERIERDGYDPDLDKGAALFLTQFKIEEGKTQDWLRDQAVDPKYWKLFGFFFARDESPNSKGYCENHEKAQLVGAKGHNVVKVLCSYCPVQFKCRENHYLSQFKRLEHKAIVVGRWQHGYMEELASYRKIIVFDESVLDLITNPTVVNADELVLRSVSPFIADQYPSEVALIEKFLTALKAALESNGDQVRYGGAWLMNELIERYGAASIERLIKLPKKVIEGVNPFDTADLSNLTNALPSYLLDLLEILRYEYETHQGAKAWNSRLIPYKHDLYIFPMEAFRFTKNTRVFAADATPLPEYYRLLFADNHTVTIEREDGKKETLRRPRPRQLDIFDTQLEPKAHVTVYTDSENTKTTFSYNSKHIEQIVIPDATPPDPNLPTTINDALNNVHSIGYSLQDTIKLAAQIRPLNAELAHFMIMAHKLAERYHGNMLIVLYKFMVGDDEQQTFIRRWLLKSGIVPMNNVQWFYALRGKNDWKHCEAVLLVGTPRIREETLLMKAQVLNWDNPNPISAEREWRDEPYASAGDDGIARAYHFWGYKDQRVNRLYVHMIASELRQDYERNRANLGEGKHVHLATPFPCSDHVNTFTRWETAIVELVVQDVLTEKALEYRKTKATWKESELLQKIQDQAECSRNTAADMLDKEYRHGFSPFDNQGAKLRWYDETVLPRNYGGSQRSKVYGHDPVQKIAAWLRSGAGQKIGWFRLTKGNVKKQYRSEHPDEPEPDDKDIAAAIKLCRDEFKPRTDLAV